VWALAEGGGELFVGTTSGLFFGAPSAFSGRGQALGRAALVLGTLPDDWVTALAYRDGTLFAGTYSAGVAGFRVDARSLAPSSVDPSLGYVNPAGLALLPDGRLAIATMDGLRCGVLGNTARLSTRASDVTAISANPTGGYWIATRLGLERRTGFD
jgi:ligand-binding sensor domain-containing protein